MHYTALLFVGSLALSACSSLAPALRPYEDAAPTKLIEQVDRSVYSPVKHGLKTLEADLLVDVTGFFPPASRPAEPMWLPVKFHWAQGAAQFEPARWPAQAQPLQKQVLALLQGKEEDIVNRPFGERLAGYRLELHKENRSLQIVARQPGAESLGWVLTVDEEFRVTQMRTTTERARVESEIHYGKERPALLRRIDSTYTAGSEKTFVQVEYSYGKAGEFVLPDELTYRTMIDRAEFPPFRIRVRNVKTAK